MNRRVILAVAIVAAGGLTRSPAGAQAQWQDVLRNLRHPDADTRLKSVNTLADAAYTPAAEAVAPLVTDADDRVQAAAIEAELTFYLTERISQLKVMSIGNSRSRAQQAFEAGPLVRGSAPAPPVLIDRLLVAVRDENPRVRFDAIHAVGFLATPPPLTPEQTTALTDALDHYDPIIRAAASRVAARLQTREAADKLLAAVNDSNALVRQYAIEALGYLREERALLPLRDIISRNRGDLVDDAWLALARIGSPEDVERFRANLPSRNAVVRRGAAEGLGRARDQASIPALQALLKDNQPAVKLAAMYALQQLGEVHTHEIAAMLILRDEATQAREYLFEIGHDSVAGAEAVLKVATDSRHRADLIQLIGYVGTAADASIIEPFARDKDERVARATSHALARLRR
ncbi:MAG TPA: HEAT repeat domain-containing protein [Vicinamibacterales bacterium]|nr:HEAT repeat domain-containing protein [Vicinamibacterales bacterium]